LGVYPMKCIRAVIAFRFVRPSDQFARWQIDGQPVVMYVCGKCVEVCNAKALEILGHRMTIGQLVTEVKKTKLSINIRTAGHDLRREPLFDTEFALNLLRH